MIERYRKPGGFVQLLNLLETTGKDKQEKFLKMIADESPIWETEVRKRLLTLDKVLGWNPAYLGEIFPRVQPIQLAMIAGGLPPDKLEAFLGVLNFKERRVVEETLKEKKPNPGEVTSGVMKLFAEIRKMEAEGSLKFEKFDPDMVIPEEIEEKLGKGFAIHTGPKEIEATLQSIPQNGSGAIPANVLEELAGLRKKLVSLSQENHKLQTDNKTMKEKLEQIKKIA
jgi:hypothetical protein